MYSIKLTLCQWWKAVNLAIGKIPVIPTELGRLSPSICYDADFPQQMRQLGKSGTSLLMLPSGDWSAIAKYHAQMALFRAIENGCSIFRQTSGGLSVATDFRGKVYGQFDYYTPGNKMWLTALNIGPGADNLHLCGRYCRIHLHRLVDCYYNATLFKNVKYGLPGHEYPE